MILSIALAGFLVAGGCAAVRLWIGPTLADRILALDVALVSLMGGIATHVAAGGDPTLLGLLPPVAVVAFTATVAASRFVEHEGVP